VQPDLTDTEPSGFGEWCVIELMGHRRVVGYVSEQLIAGRQFLRVDRPAAHGEPALTQYYSPAAVYGLHPTTEAMVRAAVAQVEPYRPLERWELPAGPDNHGDPR